MIWSAINWPHAFSNTCRSVHNGKLSIWTLRTPSGVVEGEATLHPRERSSARASLYCTSYSFALILRSSRQTLAYFEFSTRVPLGGVPGWLLLLRKRRERPLFVYERD